jgi:hypothetical protein
MYVEAIPPWGLSVEEHYQLYDRTVYENNFFGWTLQGEEV